MAVAVHQTRPADPTVAGWLRAILDPVVQSCRIAAPPPLELRPTGVWGGFCEGRSLAPDGRISTSNRAVFWTKDRLVEVYLHEAAHRLLDDADPDVAHWHDAPFFCVNYLLLRRLDDAERVSDGIRHYDLQDAPACLAYLPRAEWLPRCMAWSMMVADELAPTDLSAEACAGEIVRRYSRWVFELKREPEERAALEADVLRRQRAAQFEIHQSRTLARQRGWYCLTGSGWFIFSTIALVFLAIK